MLHRDNKIDRTAPGASGRLLEDLGAAETALSRVAFQDRASSVAERLRLTTRTWRSGDPRRPATKLREIGAAVPACTPVCVSLSRDGYTCASTSRLRVEGGGGHSRDATADRPHFLPEPPLLPSAHRIEEPCVCCAVVRFSRRLASCTARRRSAHSFHWASTSMFFSTKCLGVCTQLSAKERVGARSDLLAPAGRQRRVSHDLCDGRSGGSAPAAAACVSAPVPCARPAGARARAARAQQRSAQEKRHLQSRSSDRGSSQRYWRSPGAAARPAPRSFLGRSRRARASRPRARRRSRALPSPRPSPPPPPPVLCRRRRAPPPPRPHRPGAAC